MFRIAVALSALVGLAIGAWSDAAASSAPVSQLVAEPGIAVTDQGVTAAELSQPLITFSKSLGITLTVNSTVSTTKCAVTDPAYQWATLQLVDPHGAKSDLGALNNSDLYGSADCTGHHSRTKSFSLAGPKGNYLLIVVVNTLVNRRPKSGPYFVYPNIRIEADGVPAVDRSFPSYGDAAQITQVIPIVFK